MRARRSPPPRRSLLAVGALLLFAGGCSFLHNQGPSEHAIATAATPDVVLPMAAGHQSSGAIRNDVISGETTATGTSRGGDYVVRHGFYPPSSPSAPTGTN